MHSKLSDSEGSQVNLLLLHIEMSHRRYRRHLFSRASRMPPFRGAPCMHHCESSWGRPRTRPKGSACYVVVNRAREVWTSLLRPLTPRPHFGQAVDNRWMEKQNPSFAALFLNYESCNCSSTYHSCQGSVTK